MKRRGFFQSLAKAAAIVALAPQLAFRVRPEMPNPAWNPADYQGEWQFVTFVRAYDPETGETLEHGWERPTIIADKFELKTVRYKLLDGKYERV